MITSWFRSSRTITSKGPVINYGEGGGASEVLHIQKGWGGGGQNEF